MNARLSILLFLMINGAASGIEAGAAIAVQIERPIVLKVGYAPTYQGWSAAGELSLGTLPITLGAEVFGAYPSSYIWSAWTRLTPAHPVETLAWGPVFGVNREQRLVGSMPPGPQVMSVEPLGLVIGLAFQETWGPFWWRATPSLTIIPDPYFLQFPNFLFASVRSLLAGPAWFELGYRVHPNLELSLRTSPAPLKATLVF